MSNSREKVEESALESFLYTAGVSESEFLPHLNIRALIQLTRTNRGIHGLFTEPRLRETLLNALMAHLSNIIVNKPNYANIEKLKKILNVYPELLTRKVKKIVFQQTGQAYINYSLLQLAFAEGDDELCCDVLEPCFEQAFGGKEAAREEIRKQLNEKFPEESEEEKQQRDAETLKIKNHLAGLLAPVIQALTNEHFNNWQDDLRKLILSPTTLTDIAIYREAFNALQQKLIVKGRRFRLNTILEIYDAYLQAARQWQYDDNRCALFEDGVLAPALAYMPQNDAMRGAQGIVNLQGMTSERFLRRIRLRDININFYNLLRGASSDFSTLVGSCVDIAFGKISDINRGDASNRMFTIFALVITVNSYINQKQQTCETYAASQRLSSRSTNNLLK